VDYAPGAASPFDAAKLGAPGPLDTAPLASPIRDFYLTNPIARASVTMAECARAAAERAGARTAAE
jgi:NADH-quinone oxidoreductase subunit G